MQESGLQDGWALDDGGNILFTKEVAQSIAGAGARWVRINFRLGRRYPDWEWVAPLDRSTALMRYRQIVANARAANLKILGLLSNESWHGHQEDWQQNAAERIRGASGGNDYLEAFAKKTTHVIRSFMGMVDCWEIWNEPNMWTQRAPDGGYTGGSYIYPSNFVWLLCRMRAELQTCGAGNIPLISGGLFAFDATTADDYLVATFENGKWFDKRAVPVQGIGYHLYIDQGGPVEAQKIHRYLDTLRTTTRTNRCETLPFWITEIGWSTKSVSDEVQAANLSTAYDACNARDDVQSAIWFQRIDIPPAGLAFGLLRADGSKKPSWDASKQAAIAH